MSLTKNDLTAIQQIVKTTVQPMIDELAQDMASGFAEVHEKIDGVEKRLDEKIDGVGKRLGEKIDSISDTMGRIELVQRAEIERVDQQSKKLTKLYKKFA